MGRVVTAIRNAYDMCHVLVCASGGFVLVSIITCAQMSHHVYSDSVSGLADDWEQLHASGGPVYRVEWGANSTHKVRVDSGFFGAIYKHSSARFVVAFRGTELTDPGDIAADLSIGRSALNFVRSFLGSAGFQHEQVKDAKKLLKLAESKHSISPKSCLVTGHSLGGALAKVVASPAGYTVVAFNSPGMSNVVIDSKSRARIVNVRTTGDIVSTVGDQETKPLDVTLPPKSTQVGKYGREIEIQESFFGQHSMLNMLRQVSLERDRFGVNLI